MVCQDCGKLRKRLERALDAAERHKARQRQLLEELMERLKKALDDIRPAGRIVED
jgi:uncharacterized protein with von Willebrand factor type A (vWA) domain